MVEEPLLFGSSDFEDDDKDVIDLVDKDEVVEPPAPEQPQGENTIRLGHFQCVICMDDVQGLTVTHCGMSLPFLPIYTPTKRNLLLTWI